MILDDTEKLYSEISDSDILTNATIVGMKPYENDTNILDTNVFRKRFGSYRCSL